jgi:hypothetical protein
MQDVEVLMEEAARSRGVLKGAASSKGAFGRRCKKWKCLWEEAARNRTAFEWSGMK